MNDDYIKLLICNHIKAAHLQNGFLLQKLFSNNFELSDAYGGGGGDDDDDDDDDNDDANNYKTIDNGHFSIIGNYMLC